MTRPDQKHVDTLSEILQDLEQLEDVTVNDTGDPDTIEIVIRAKLKDDIGRVPDLSHDDYDRAMRGTMP